MTCECAKFLIDGITSTEIVWTGNGEQLNKEYYLISLTKQVTKKMRLVQNSMYFTNQIDNLDSRQ